MNRRRMPDDLPPDRSNGDTAVADLAAAARDAVFAPIGGGSLVEQTVRRLGEAIGMGLLREGERLPAESELAARLEIAPMTLRQALAILRDSGYLETVRGRGGGTFVKSSRPVPLPADRPVLGADELRDLTEYRVAVSGYAAALAARRATNGEVEQLDGLVREMRDADAFTRYRQLDSQFHLGIASASRSRRLLEAESAIQRDLLAALTLAGDEPVGLSLEPSNASHTRLVAALSVRDAVAARDEMVAHVRGTADVLVGLRLGVMP